MSSPAATASARRPPILDLASLLYLGVVWGAVFLFMRVASPHVGAAWAAELRLTIAAVALLVIAGHRTVALVRRRPVDVLVTGALFAAIPFTLIAFATQFLPAGFAALLNAATPLFTALVGVAFLGQRLVPRVSVGLAVGLVAVVVLAGWSPLETGPSLLLATAAGLGAPASYAVAGHFVRSRMRGVPPLDLASSMLLVGALLVLPVALVTGPPVAPAPDALLSLVLAGTVSTALAWPIYFRVLSRTSATAASTVTFIVPAFALAWGSAVLGEAVGIGLAIGFGLLLVSLGLVLGLVSPGTARLPVRARRALGALAAA